MPAVIAVAAVTAGEAVVAAAVATAALDATEIGPPGRDRWCRGVAFHAPTAPAPSSTVGASRVADGIEGHTSVMPRLDLLSKSSILPLP